ncbi:MAG: hypothetical protein KAS39_00760, partial [Actinomycetia bacterium]|nr:hypothetical protein [Actinomycetes bacterium]
IANTTWTVKATKQATGEIKYQVKVTGELAGNAVTQAADRKIFIDNIPVVKLTEMTASAEKKKKFNFGNIDEINKIIKKSKELTPKLFKVVETSSEKLKNKEPLENNEFVKKQKDNDKNREKIKKNYKKLLRLRKKIKKTEETDN